MPPQKGQLLGHFLDPVGKLGNLNGVMEADEHEEKEPEDEQGGGGRDGPDQMSDED